MKRLFKRTLAMVLTVALCVSTLQLTAFAAELDPVTPDAEEVIHDHDHSDAEEVTTAEHDGAEGEQEDQPLGADVETNVSTSNPADGEENPGTDTEEPSDEEETETDVEEASVEEEPEADVEETSGEGKTEVATQVRKAVAFKAVALPKSEPCKDNKHIFGEAQQEGTGDKYFVVCTECGYICHQADEYGHKMGYPEKIVYPTCVKDGYTLHKCSECLLQETNPIPALGYHTWKDWNVTKEPTCTAAGEKERACEVCGETEQVDIPPLTHEFKGWEVTKKATCAEEGLESNTCRRCNHTETRPIPKLQHELVSKVVTPATCCKEGLEYLSCNNCGYKGQKVLDKDPTNHICYKDGNLIDELLTEGRVTDSTCTKKGDVEWLCSGCNAVVKNTSIDMVPHKKVSRVIKEATCKEDGLQEFYCEWCGISLGEGKIVQDPNNHVCLKDDGNLDWDVLNKRTVKIATCTEVGRIEYVCPGCGKVMETEEIPIDPTRHIRGNKLDDAQSIPATCTTPGKEVFVCVDCNAVLQEKELDLLGHIFSAWSPNGADNHIRTCERCHEEWTEVHKYGETVWGEWTDNEDGLTQTRVGVDTCGDCGHTVTKPETRTVNAYYTVEVYTVDANGNATLSRTETLKDRIGETVSTSGQVLAGYTLDGTRSTLSATLAESGTVLRVYYNANPTPPVTPGTTDDDDDDDDDDDEPYTPPTVVVPDEPTPLTPTPVGPVAPAAPVAPVTPVTPPTVEVEDPQVPLAENPGLVAGPLAEAGDDEVPLAVRAGWSLVNLLLTIFTALAAAWQLISRKKKDENEDEENTQNAQTTEEEDQDNRRSRLRLLSLVPAVGSVLLFIFNENLRNPMILVNRLTVVMVMIAAVQVALMVLTAQSEDDEDDRQEAARA